LTRIYTVDIFKETLTRRDGAVNETLSERSRAILRAVVQDYINTVEPVSSRAIATRYSFGLSPATIRKTMSELETEGYLTHPHTSAGRVPTEKSFRLYVDTLLEIEEPREVEKYLINSMRWGYLSVEDCLRETAKALSNLTCCAGLLLAPRPDFLIVKDIRFLRISGSTLLVMIVSAEGIVHTRPVRVGPEIERLDLERVSNYLNSIGGGLSLEALRARVVEEMKREKNLYDELLRNALKLSDMAIKEVTGTIENEVYVEGRANIFEQPEFAEDMERMKRIFGAFEEKGLLVKILDRTMENKCLRIWIGSESNVKEFEGLSFVSAPYGRCGETLGAVGVIGPVRMNYSKIIPLVNYAAGFLGDAL
jgi:heat-inducible transcriptional repressor